MLVEPHVGEHFDARRDGGGGVFRKLHRVVQDAVDAITYEKRVFQRLDVNVARALRIGVPQERIDDADRRDALRHLAQVLLLFFYGPRLCERLRLALDDVAEIILEPLLVLLEREFYRRDIGQARQDLEARLLLDEVDRGEVIGVEHRDFQFIAVVVVGDDVVAPCDGFGDEAQRLVLDDGTDEGDERNAEDVCVGATKLILPYRIVRREDVAHLLPALLRLPLRRIEIFLTDQTRIGEK